MKTILTTILLCFSLNTIAEVSPEWVRYPAISPNGETIAFTYKGDIYTVPVLGGQATRLTFHEAHDYKPVWSNNSQQIAFASDRFGNFDIYTMDARGGKSKRLTFHSTHEEPYTFTNDNQNILFKGQRSDLLTHRQYPSSRLAELYSVPTIGGRIEQVLTIPAEDVQINQSGDQYVYHDNKGAENAWRKHHQSSATRDIWTYDINAQKHEKISSFNGEDRNPIYADDGKSIYYLSEESGTFNIHTLNLQRPKRNKQLTSFDLHPVRFLSKGMKNGAEILAFSYHGILHTMIPGDSPKPVNLSIRTQDIDNNIEMVSVDGDISDIAISPNGKEIAFISNGEVFVSSADGSFTKQITKTAAQESFITFSPDGEYLLYAGERDSKWSIFKATKARTEEPFFYASTLINEETLISNEFDNYQPKISPDGKQLAFIEDRRSLKVMDLESAKTTTLITPEDMLHMSDGDQTFSWSPDSQWVIFEYNKLLNNADIAIIAASGKEDMKVLIPSGYYDSSPKWVNGGKQIIWFSNRDGLKSYATSGRSQSDIYTLFFNQEDWDKFNLSENDYDLMLAIEEAAKESEEDKSDDKDENKDNEDAIEPLKIEWDDIEERTKKLTIHSSNLSDAVLNKDADKMVAASSEVFIVFLDA